MNLIITRANNKIQNWSDITHPIIKAYAKRCNADFKVIGHNPKDLTHRSYIIFQLYNLFEKYDRILQIDTDTLILKHCPDLFKLVPENMIGTIYEDIGSRQSYRRDLIKQIQEQREYVGWEKGYINTGVFILSKEHKEILNPIGELWDGFGFDDVEIGYRIHKLGFNIFELPFSFNHMSMFSEGWNNSHSRFDSNIIHYAGNGFNHKVDRFTFMGVDYKILKAYDLLMAL